VPGRVLYDVGAADALAHWLAQHPHVVMLAGTSHLDTYLDTAAGALLAQGQVLRIRRRDGASDATLRDLHSDTTLVETVSDGGLPDGGAIDARVRALAGREPIGTVRTVMTQRRRFVLMARRDWDTEITIDAAVVTAHGMLPARHVTCEVVALRTRPLDPVFLDALERAGELRAGALEPWERGTGRPEHVPAPGAQTQIAG
jgi:hypothetical protein